MLVFNSKEASFTKRNNLKTKVATPSRIMGFDPPMSTPADQVSAGILREQSARIVANPSFARAKSLIRLLEYLIDAHLEGRPIKEYLLGVEVFNRGVDFDPAADNIVRVQAGNLRAKLKAYYDGVGAADPLIIRLPAGSYSLTVDPLNPVIEAQPSELALPPPPAARSKSKIAAAGIFAILLAAIPVTFWFRGPAHPAGRSIAILPFSNLDADPIVQTYADGLTEELIAAFARIPGANVTARTSVWSYRNQAPQFSEIRNALKVDSMVEGSVRRNGDRLRILIRVVDTADGHLVWSSDFDPLASQIATVERQVAPALAAALKLSPAAPANRDATEADPELFALCQRGRAQWFLATVEGAHQAISLAAQTLVKDATYAPAYVVMAGAYTELVVAGRADTIENWRHVKEMAAKAIALDPANAEAHMLLAGPLAWLDWEYAAAEREYKRALEIAPGNAAVHQYYASFLSAFGRFPDARSHISVARRLDPRNPQAIWVDARLAYWAGDYARSAAVLDELRAKYPAYPLTNNLIPRVWPHVGRTAPAIAILENVAKTGNGLDAYGLLGYVYAQSGRADEARKVAAQLELIAHERFVPGASLAFVYTGLGEHAKAIANLSRACDERSLRTAYMLVDPIFQPLRNEPEFRALLRRVHLPDRK